MKSRYTLLAIAILIVVSGFVLWAMRPPAETEIRYPEEVRTALEQSTSVTLFSLDYMTPENGSAPHETPEGHTQREFFDGWLILGSVDLAGGDKEALVSAFHHSVRHWNIATSCFWPRHGLRVEYQGNTYDLVICFECNQVSVNKNGKHFANAYLHDGPADLFNQMLKDANIRLPKQPTSK